VLIIPKIISLIVENRISTEILYWMARKMRIASRVKRILMFVAQLSNSMYDVQNRMGWQSWVSLPRWGFYRCEKRRRVSSIQEFIQVKNRRLRELHFTHHQVWDENGIIKRVKVNVRTRDDGEKGWDKNQQLMLAI